MLEWHWWPLIAKYQSATDKQKKGNEKLVSVNSAILTCLSLLEISDLLSRPVLCIFLSWNCFRCNTTLCTPCICPVNFLAGSKSACSKNCRVWAAVQCIWQYCSVSGSGWSLLSLVWNVQHYDWGQGSFAGKKRPLSHTFSCTQGNPKIKCSKYLQGGDHTGKFWIWLSYVLTRSAASIGKLFTVFLKRGISSYDT